MLLPVSRNHLYLAMAKHMPGASVFLVDENLTVVAAGGIELFEVHGLLEDDLVGQNIMEFASPQNYTMVKDLYRGVLRGERRSLYGIRRESQVYDLVGHPYVEPGGAQMAMVIMTNVTARVQEIDVLLQSSTHDEMTGLLNRRGFMFLAPNRIAVAERSGEQVSLGFADMDGLKAINDTHGHAAGDAAIIDVASAIARSCRATDLAARIGGDEFVFLAVGDGAAQAISERVAIELAACRCDMSVAFTGMEFGEDVSAAMARADDEMYIRKRSRNRCAG